MQKRTKRSSMKLRSPNQRLSHLRLLQMERSRQEAEELQPEASLHPQWRPLLLHESTRQLQQPNKRHKLLGEHNTSHLTATAPKYLGILRRPQIAFLSLFIVNDRESIAETTHTFSTASCTFTTSGSYSQIIYFSHQREDRRASGHQEWWSWKDSRQIKH